MPSQQKFGGWFKIGLLLLILVGGLVASRFISRAELTAFVERAGQMGWTGYALFIAIYAIWCVLGLPASIMTLGAAVAFGFWRAMAVVVVGATLGATLAFLTARYLARDWFTQKIGRRVALAQINRAVGESGWKIVMLSRFPPVSPFSILSYAYGLTPISLGAFVVGTAIGMMPGTVTYIYLGTFLGTAAQNANRERTPLEWTIYIGGFLATVAVCIYLVRLAKKALARQLSEDNS